MTEMVTITPASRAPWGSARTNRAMGCIRRECGFANWRRRPTVQASRHREARNFPKMCKRSSREGRLLWRVISRVELLCVERYLRQGQIPVRFQDFKTPLLFAFEGRLIGEELKLQCVLIDGCVSGLRVLEGDGHAIIPSFLLGHVEGRCIETHR